MTSPQAIIITGIRRTGKTSLLRYIYDRTGQNKLLLDLENPLNRRLFEEKNYETIRVNLSRLGLDFFSQSYLFLDEIQWVPSIPSVVKYFIDHFQVKFFLTGSASFYLKNLFSESLAGRKYLFELYPLSFKEFLLFKSQKLTLPKFGEKTDQVTWELIKPFWQEYLDFGAFPEVVLAKNKQEKEKQLDDIFTSYFQREIEQLADFRKTDLVRDLIVILAENAGNLLNIERLASELGVSRITIEEWLSFLRATYLVDLVSPYSKKERVAIRKAKKIYFVDWGLARKMVSLSSGQVLENCIYHLLRIKGNVTYYRKKSGAEIDFILDKKVAVEVKKTARKTNKTMLLKLSRDLNFNKAMIIANEYSSLEGVYPGFSLA